MLERFIAWLMRLLEPKPAQPTYPQGMNPNNDIPPQFFEWPPGAYQFQPGVWYVAYAGTQGGPFKTPAEALDWMRRVDKRDANLAESDRTGAWKSPGRGSIPVTSLSRDDAAYVRYRSHDYTLKVHNGDLFRDLCSGSHDDIARAIMLGDTVNPGMKAWTPDNQALIAAVDRLFT